MGPMVKIFIYCFIIYFYLLIFLQKDTLLLSRKIINKGRKLNEASMIFLKISSPEFNCDRTLKLKDTATVGEVIYRFSRKVNDMKDVALYGLYPAKGISQLSVKRRLCELNISNMSSLTVKLHGGPPNEIYHEKQIFGVEIRSMNLVQADSGKISIYNLL